MPRDSPSLNQSEERATEASAMDMIKVGVMLPHQVFAAMYWFDSGVFHSLFMGPIDEA